MDGDVSLYKRTSTPRAPLHDEIYKPFSRDDHGKEPFDYYIPSTSDINRTSALNRRYFAEENTVPNFQKNYAGDLSDDIRYAEEDFEQEQRLQHRTTSIHRNISKWKDSFGRDSAENLEKRRSWLQVAGNTTGYSNLERHAARIVNNMERDPTLMDDTPESEQLRKEALRDMPQCLTIKRHIKTRLTTSVSQKSKHKPLGYFKRLKYRWSIALSKFRSQLKDFAYTFELWYSTLKTIEGHFGSGVATYFKFMRWQFLMDFLIMVIVLGFVTTPDVLYDKLVEEQHLQTGSLQAKDLFTGGGYFTNTSLFYGYYTSKTFSLIGDLSYNMQYAYFFTMFCIIFFAFIILSIGMARSYRRNFIETEGGLKNVFTQKVFCGWDFSIATKEAAKLKSSALYFELKELLSEMDSFSLQRTRTQIFCTRTLQIVANIFVLALLSVIGYIMWLLMEQHKTNTLTTSDNSTTVSILTAVFINTVMFVFPRLLSFIVKFENYKSPKVILNITLIRIFLLEIIVIGVLLVFWLTHSESVSCWETSLGQEIYRLILFDFLYSVIIATILEIGQYLIYKTWPRIGSPQFNIATHTLNLIYNQTLFWTGIFFAPLLCVLMVAKLLITWYVRSLGVIHLCKPSSKSWRSAQMQTWFLIMDFLSLLLVIAVYGFIIIEIKTSECGPFKNYNYIYEMLIKGVLTLEENNIFWKILMYFTRPGVIALILIAMCMSVYYLRVKAKAQRKMVQLLREMLLWEAKDKEFLLSQISKVTQGQWQYNLQKGRADVLDPYNTTPEIASSVWDKVVDKIVGGAFEDASSVNFENFEGSSHSNDVDASYEGAYLKKLY